MPAYALSIRQPWAYLIIHGYKDIENRNWPLPAHMIGQRIYVHAPSKEDHEAYKWLEAKRYFNSIPRFVINFPLVFSAIIGEVDIIEGTFKSDSPWFDGNYGFILANPVAYSTPIPCKGRLGFFKPTIPEGAII